ncbi:MAG TPA: M23 family metallopeptidase [Polyangia bacterium]|nr:M23 family metallopeptidase [Polyangia bacterium]
MACLVLTLAGASALGAEVTLEVQPPQPLLEVTPWARLLNFDLIVENHTAGDIELIEVEVSALDAHGQLAARKLINQNGIQPSILTLPERTIHPGARGILFNPLYSFPPDLPLAELRYRLTYQATAGAPGPTPGPPSGATSDRPSESTGPADAARTLVVETRVRPVVYRPRVRLQLPLHGRFIVWDGHDFLSHHRRFNYTHPVLQELGFKTNASRYSYDFVPIAGDGTLHQGAEAPNEHWYGFGVTLYAPGDGRVVALADDAPDDHHFDLEAAKKNSLALFGNYIVIDHGHGEYSVLGHIRQKSARVRLGDRVRAGQPVAAMGASGSSLFPHLHYQLQTTIDESGEGLPSYFHGFKRVLGARTRRERYGAIDTGDIIEN